METVHYANLKLYYIHMNITKLQLNKIKIKITIFFI
jgi:hypothetical protein